MMSWFPVNISNFIYAIQSGFFGGLPSNDSGLGDSSTAPPPVTTTTPDQSKSSTSVVHLVTTCVLYLNTIINPMIYAMSASSMRNRILTSIRPRQNSSLGSISEKTKELSQGSSDPDHEHFGNLGGHQTWTVRRSLISSIDGHRGSQDKSEVSELRTESLKSN